MAFSGNALCGPSNALKSFSDNFERDRSLQQDRFAPAHLSAPSAFKSVSDPSHNGEYRAFIGNGANGLPPLPMDHHSLPLMPGQPMHQQLGGLARPAPSTHATIPADNGASWWTAEYNAMNNPAVGASRQAVAPPVQQVRHMSPPVALTMTRPYVPAPSASFGLGHGASMGMAYDPFVDQARPHFAQGPIGVPAAAQNYGGMTEAELQASFDKFEAYENDFEDEMDTWMAQHGPRAEQEQQKINETMERLADDLDQAKLREEPGLFADDVAPEITEEKSADEMKALDTDLSKTAAQIVDSVAATTATNEKFKNSAFLDLMRRVASSQVVLRDDDLVDADSGKPATSVSEPARQSTAAFDSSSDQRPPTPPIQNWWTGDLSDDKGKGKATATD